MIKMNEWMDGRTDGWIDRPVGDARWMNDATYTTGTLPGPRMEVMMMNTTSLKPKKWYHFLQNKTKQIKITQKLWELNEIVYKWNWLKMMNEYHQHYHQNRPVQRHHHQQLSNNWTNISSPTSASHAMFSSDDRY